MKIIENLPLNQASILAFTMPGVHTWGLDTQESYFISTCLRGEHFVISGTFLAPSMINKSSDDKYYDDDVAEKFG